MHVEACKDSEWLIQTDLAKGGLFFICWLGICIPIFYQRLSCRQSLHNLIGIYCINMIIYAVKVHGGKPQ